MAVEAMNPDGSNRIRLDQLPRQAALAGWTTPQAHDVSGRSKNQKAIHGTKHGCACLVMDAAMAGWPAPCAQDGPNGGPSQGTDRLPGAVSLAGWPTTTATATDASRGKGTIRPHDTGIPLPQRAAMATPARLCSDGTLLTGSTAGMASGGRLNPAHSRWLIRLPPEWDDCAPTAMPSTRKPRRNSSER